METSTHGQAEAGVLAEARFTSAELAERTQHRCAIESVIWGMPAVNAQLLFDAVKACGSDFNQIVYWSRPLTWKNQTLTPNPSTIYVFAFYNTKDVGPMVLEIPPADGHNSITGSVDDGWQTALADVGPAGVDQGKGGKYLILPPGYKANLPDGYISLPSRTYAGFAVLRSNLASSSTADVANAVTYGKRIKFYRLSQAASSPETKFVDAIDVLFDSTIPYDLRFFEALDRFVQREPWIDRDRVMIDSLRTVGIEKGRSFNPDDETKRILRDAGREARAWLDRKYELMLATPYNEGFHWGLPALPEVIKGMTTDFADPDDYPVEGRGMLYSYVYFSPKHLGAGQFYLMTVVDKDGKPLDGGSSYRLNVPANPPVKLYWSATAYDRATHALIREMPSAACSSVTPGLTNNADGSVDVFFGPKAPAGKEANWVPTKSASRFEVMFRFYGPEKPLFDKAWKLPDLEKAR
ncbi:MAG TPA: DUF1254 domain-containing protein [Polyangia bacterium]|nr:DUF1254 domain-containing protein [Polyangia bacterium]